MATMAALFDMSPACDAAGNPILPSLEFEEGFVRHPKSFSCSIKPRSESVLTLIRQATSEVELD